MNIFQLLKSFFMQYRRRFESFVSVNLKVQYVVENESFDFRLIGDVKSHGGWKPALSASEEDLNDKSAASNSKLLLGSTKLSKPAQGDYINRATAAYGDWKDVAASEMKKIYGKIKSGALVSDSGRNTPKLARRVDWTATVRTPFAGDGGRQLRLGSPDGGVLDGDELNTLHSAVRTALLDEWLGNGLCDGGYVRHGEKADQIP